jgi:hypothetical protein
MDLSAELDGRNWPPQTSIFASAVSALHPSIAVPNKPTPYDSVPTRMVHFACNNRAHSAVAAMGMLLQHHRIGWNHIPKTEYGTPDNDAFMATVESWLRHASQCSGQHLLQSLHRAGLQPQGYSEGSSSTLISLLHQELSEQRPVLALTQGDPTQDEPHTVWRVLYHINPHTHSIHTHNPFDAEQRLVWSLEEWLHKLTGQANTPQTNADKALNYTVLTACKPTNQPRLFEAHNARSSHIPPPMVGLR